MITVSSCSADSTNPMIYKWTSRPNLQLFPTPTLNEYPSELRQIKKTGCSNPVHDDSANAE